METITVFNFIQILTSIFMAWTAYNNTRINKEIKELKIDLQSQIKELEVFMAHKQDVKTCILHHKNHEEIHKLEKEMNENGYNDLAKDINGIGKKLSSHIERNL